MLAWRSIKDEAEEFGARLRSLKRSISAIGFDDLPCRALRLPLSFFWLPRRFLTTPFISSPETRLWLVSVGLSRLSSEVAHAALVFVDLGLLTPVRLKLEVLLLA